MTRPSPPASGSTPGKQDEIKVAYDRKKAELKARLDAEQQALDAEMRQVQARLAEIARELRARRAGLGKLRADVQRRAGAAAPASEQRLAGRPEGGRRPARPG